MLKESLNSTLTSWVNRTARNGVAAGSLVMKKADVSACLSSSTSIFYTKKIVYLKTDHKLNTESDQVKQGF